MLPCGKLFLEGVLETANSSAGGVRIAEAPCGDANSWNSYLPQAVLPWGTKETGQGRTDGLVNPCPVYE